jgi:hypothetical protein
MEGRSNMSAIMAKCNSGRIYQALVPLEHIAAKERQVPDQYINDIHGPNQDFVDEFLFTIGGPMALPHYSDISLRPVQMH